jgi:hypothetical protein
MDIPDFEQTSTSKEVAEVVAEKKEPKVKGNVKNVFKNEKLPFYVGVAFVLLVVVAVGYFLIVYQKELTDTENLNAAIFTPEEDEVDYESRANKFKMVLKKDWNVNEFGTKVEIKTNDNGLIMYEKFDDDELAQIDEVDQAFCDSFETGFQEGLGNSENAKSFSFNYTELNGLAGCIAEGEIYEGYRQQYRVLFNEEVSEVYSLFYTTGNLENEQDLKDSLLSFRVVN